MYFKEPSFFKIAGGYSEIRQYLNEKKLSDELYSFQLFMKDYNKSAVRCLKLFCENDNLEQKLAFLNKAEQHLSEELKQSREAFLFMSIRGQLEQKHARITHINKLIALQKELLLNFPEMKHLHFFVNQNAQRVIAQSLLLIEESDLGLRLMQIWEMEFGVEIGESMEKLAKEGDLANLERLMQNIVSWKKNGGFQKVGYKNAGGEVIYKSFYSFY